MVTIEKLLTEGTKIIEQREYNNPFLDVQTILAYLLHKDRIYLHAHKKDEVDAGIEEKFYEMVKKRNEGYPLQYMINSQEFMGLDFYVAEGVLIPRPDTEILVEKIIDIVKNGPMKEKDINILDIGTGSGAIAVSLGYYLGNANVTAMDVSDDALKIAGINVKKHGLKNVELLEGDIFCHDFGDNKYHIVVSNPPYIESEIIGGLQTEVAVHEPRLALDGGTDGLNYYRRIVDVYRNIHEESGILSVEIGCDQRTAVTGIFEGSDLFAKVEGYRDLSGKDRVVTGFL